MTCRVAIKEAEVHGVWRAGPPTTVVCKVRVPLTETPPPAWRHAFHVAMRAALPVDASPVAVVDGALVFACDPGRVDELVARIDQCIVAANHDLPAAAPPPLYRDVHVAHRDLTWEEKRLVAEAARRAETLKDY